MTTTEQSVPALIDCETAARTLYDYLDGRLPNATMATVKQHVEMCECCASHFAFARRVLDLIPAAVPLATEPHALRAKIIASLRTEGFREPARDA